MHNCYHFDYHDEKCKHCHEQNVLITSELENLEQRFSQMKSDIKMLRNDVNNKFDKMTASIDTLRNNNLPRLIPTNANGPLNLMNISSLEPLICHVKLDSNFWIGSQALYLITNIALRFKLSHANIDKDCFIGMFQLKKSVRNKKGRKNGFKHLSDESSFNRYNLVKGYYNISIQNVFGNVDVIKDFEADDMPDVRVEDLKTEWDIKLDNNNQTLIEGPIALLVKALSNKGFVYNKDNNTAIGNEFKVLGYVIDNKINLNNNQATRNYTHKKVMYVGFAVMKYTKDMKQPEIGPMTIFKANYSGSGLMFYSY